MARQQAVSHSAQGVTARPNSLTNFETIIRNMAEAVEVRALGPGLVYLNPAASPCIPATGRTWSL